MTKTTKHISPKYPIWMCIAVCGGIWGLALARVLAYELHWVFFFSIGGALTGAAVGSGTVLLLAKELQKRDNAPWHIAQSLIPLLLPLFELLDSTFHPWRGPVLLLSSLLLTGVSLSQNPIPRKVGFILAIGIPIAIYMPDISPYVGRADTFEFQVVAPQLGIAHPSGYPLYILIGKLFSFLPISTSAWRINFSSAVFAALASGTLFLTLSTREKHDTRLIALLTALTLAFSPTLWSRAIEAEVYAPNACLTAIGLWLATRWAAGKLPPHLALPAFGLLTGIAMASHITLGALIFLALPLLLTTKPRPTFRTLLLAIGLGITGLALYLYIPLRWPAVTGGEHMSLTQFFNFVTNSESGGALHPMAFLNDLARWTLVLRLVQMQVGWVGLAIAFMGLVNIILTHWKIGLGSLLAFSAWLWFNLSFYVAEPDYSAFLIPGHIVILFWMGYGGMTLASFLEKNPKANDKRQTAKVVNTWQLDGKKVHSFIQRPLSIIYLSLLVLLAASRLWLIGPSLDTISTGHTDEAWGRYVLAQNLAQDAAILADSEKFPPLYYLQQVAGLRPDLEMVMLFNEAQYREALQTRLAAGQSVYLARYLPGLDGYGVSSAGPLVEVAPNQTADPESVSPLAQFGNQLALLKYDLEQDPQNRAAHHLRLIWYAEHTPNDDLGIRLRLNTPEGEVVWQSEESRPVGGYTITQAWRPGSVVQDYHSIPWADWLLPGQYHLELGVFPRFSDEGLGIDHKQWFGLTELNIPERDAPALPHRLDMRFGRHIRLTGKDLPGETWENTPTPLNLSWIQTSANNATLMLRWVKLDGQPQPAFAVQPLGKKMTYAFNQNTPQRYIIKAPQNAGKYRLEAGWSTPTHTMLPAQCGWAKRTQSFCSIGQINVASANTGLANFAQRILLLDAKLDTKAVPAGGQAIIDLHWRGLRTMEQNYTVFVQIIGPDGKLYGQIDSWPVQGARPTSGWTTGEEIHDPYRLYLDEGAPVGTYQVITGWYLLADMGRLAIINAEGKPSGDFYSIGEFSLSMD